MTVPRIVKEAGPVTSDQDLDLLSELLHIRRTVDAVAAALGVDLRSREHDRDAGTGRYVTEQYAKDNPERTVHEND